MECLIRRLLICYNHVMLEKIEILKETQDYIAVYKPAGLPVETKDTFSQDLEGLVTRMSRSRTDEAEAKSKPSASEKSAGFAKAGRKSRPGRNAGQAETALNQVKAVNRLDLPVEGIVLLAKNKKAAAELSRQIRDREARKIYYAVVENIRRKNDDTAGNFLPPGTRGSLRNFLKKDPASNSSEVVEEGTPGAKEALLDYEVLAVRDRIFLLKIRLHTGRHHQIRVQLSAAGMPVLNDAKYGNGAKVKIPSAFYSKAETADLCSASVLERNKTKQAPASTGIGQGRRFLQRGGSMRAAVVKKEVFPALCAAELDFRDPETGEKVELRVKPLGEAFRIFKDIY